MLVLSLAAAHAANGAPTHSHFSYFEGNRYAFIISEEKYAAMRAWNPNSSDFPPVPPGRALQIAEERLRKILIPNNYGWRLEAVALEPVNEFYSDGKWMYVVHFRYFINGLSTGVWPSMNFIVTMDGELVEPVISVARPNR
jgi:hypothetical protein